MNLSFSLKCSTLLCKITSNFFAFKNNIDHSLRYSIDSYRFCGATKFPKMLKPCRLVLWAQNSSLHILTHRLLQNSAIWRVRIGLGSIVYAWDVTTNHQIARKDVSFAFFLAAKLKRYVTWSHNQCKTEWHLIILNICQKCRKYIFALLMFQFSWSEFQICRKILKTSRMEANLQMAQTETEAL